MQCEFQSELNTKHMQCAFQIEPKTNRTSKQNVFFGISRRVKPGKFFQINKNSSVFN